MRCTARIGEYPAVQVIPDHTPVSVMPLYAVPSIVAVMCAAQGYTEQRGSAIATRISMNGSGGIPNVIL